MALELPAHHRATGLVDVLDRVLDKGLVIAGDIKVSLAEVELLTIRIRLLVCSLDKAQEIGLDWWRYDRDLSPGGQRRGQRRRAEELRAQIRSSSASVDALTRPRGRCAAGGNRQRAPRTRRSREWQLNEQQGGTSLIDVLDRVLDKGIVIDAWVRVSLVGIDLITVEARVVVASIDTYLKYSEAVGQVSPVSRPPAELTAAPERHRRERRAARGAGGRPRARAPRTSRPRKSRTEGPKHEWPRRVTVHGAVAPVATSPAGELEAKLALAEFLLASTDLQDSARRAVDWLVAHTPITNRRSCRRSQHAIGTSAGLVAEHGVSSARDRRTSRSTRDDEAHPLDPGAHRRRADLFRRARTLTVQRRRSKRRFHAIPLRADEDRCGSGCCWRARPAPSSSRTCTWLAAPARPSRSRGSSSRGTLAETRFGQERMLLYSIINAVTDPILLTDTEGRLIIANARAEKLFAAPRKRARAGGARWR